MHVPCRVSCVDMKCRGCCRGPGEGWGLRRQRELPDPATFRCPRGFARGRLSPFLGAAAPHAHLQLFLALFCCMQLHLFLTFSWGWGAREGRGEDAEKRLLISAGPGPAAARPSRPGRGEPGGVSGPSPVRWSPGSTGGPPLASEMASPKFSWMCLPLQVTSVLLVCLKPCFSRGDARRCAYCSVQGRFFI